MRADLRAELLNAFRRVLTSLEEKQWFTWNAAENTYCPDCVLPEERWRDQREHHPGCLTVKLMEDIKQLIIDVEAL